MSEYESQQLLSTSMEHTNNSLTEDYTPEVNHPPILGKNDEIFEMNDSFDFSGFQVVRREFFAHLSEPAVSFNNCKFYVNMACLSKFPETEYVQALINRETKILALRPCNEGERDSFLWCYNSKGKRKPKQITCKLFFAKIVSLMDWDHVNRYKLLGKLIHANGEYLLAFDLTATEVYQRTFPEGEKPKTSRIPVYPHGWQDQFGLPFNEHRKSMQVNIFEGYAVYAIKEKQSHIGNASESMQDAITQSSNDGDEVNG